MFLSPYSFMLQDMQRRGVNGDLLCSSVEWSREVNAQGVLNTAVTRAVDTFNPCHIHGITVQAVWRCPKSRPRVPESGEPEALPSSLHRRDLPGHPAVLNKLLNQHRILLHHILFSPQMKESRIRNRLFYIQGSNNQHCRIYHCQRVRKGRKKLNLDITKCKI